MKSSKKTFEKKFYMNKAISVHSNRYKLSTHLLVLVATLWDPPLLSPAVKKKQKSSIIVFFSNFTLSCPEYINE